MEENLRTVRFVHRAIMAVAATIIAFAASVVDQTKYDAVISELNAIVSVDRADFESFKAQYGYELLSKKERKDIWDKLEGETGRQLDFRQFEYEAPTLFSLDDAPLHGKLEKLYDYFGAIRETVTFGLDPDEFADSLIKAIGTSNPGGALTIFEMKITPEEVGGLQGSVELVVLDGPIMAAIAPRTVTFQVPIEVHRGEADVLRWFNQVAVENSKTAVIDKRGKPFPALQSVWSEVRHRPPFEAYGYISAKIEASKQEITFIGLTVGKDLVLLAGPLATLILIVYLMCHLLHVRTMASSNRVLLREFPWMAIFNNTLARSLALASLTALPLAAQTYLIWQSYRSHHATQLSLLAALLMTVAVMIAGVYASRIINQLRVEAHTYSENEGQ